MTSLAFLVDPVFYRTPGGTGAYVRNLVPALARADPSLELRLFHARFDGARAEPWMGRFPVAALPWPVRRLYPSWTLLRRPPLPSPLSGTALLHSPTPVAVPPPAGGQRLVVTVHDLAFLVHPGALTTTWRLLHRAGLRRTVRTARAVIAPSRHTAEDLLRRTRLPADRVHVVPLAPALPEGAADVSAVLDRLKVRRPYVLFVGTLEPRKNLVRLVQAYRRVAAGVPHALVLAGPMGWRPRPLLQAVAEEGPGRVVLTGRLPEEALDALYRGADAFVYPSLYEGFGLPVLEAMARGIPCVVSAASSLPEVAGEAALLVDPRSTADLAGAIERVLTDGALAERLREAGRAWAGRFSWDETARRTLKVYRSLL
ncbi:MAG TPA: glycosyltransferase family 1 protein [Actinomycetota bacterium]|nr:glycosyltransferase family 1 protein [Actinomycetota bacterium]